MSDAPAPDRRIGPRELRASAAAAMALIGRAAPVRVPLFLALTVATAATPVATAWLTKLVIDRLTGAHGPVAGLALGLVAAGTAAAFLPLAAQYARAQIGRAAGAAGTDRLFAAAERQVGLRAFEDPAFQDRLRLAQQAVQRLPEIVDGFGGGSAGFCRWPASSPPSRF
ncbi:hypothetical protein ACFQY7_06865 [Actinomadura luteofluorescens]|uniref:hypothetical protein n=1 Tax=Actinomadura luteofluorescens TaxID=46163 RepID=UPI00363212CD